MYQIQTKQGGTFTPTTTCCEIWRLLPEEEWTVFEEAESLKTSIYAQKALDREAAQEIINLTFPGWTVSHCWHPNPDDEGEF